MEIKRILTFCDEVRSEAGQRTQPPLRKSAVVAVVHNPFAVFKPTPSWHRASRPTTS